MKQNGTIELFQYWNRLRNGRPAPDRTEIEPSDIKTLLADTFILELDSRQEAVFRLAGTRICSVFGRELKGFSFVSLWNERDVSMISKLAGDVFINQSVVIVSFIAQSKGGRELDFEVLLLPLAGGRENQRALGTIVAEKRPFWLGVDPIVDCKATSIRVVDPEREPMFLKNRPAVPIPSLSPVDIDIGPEGTVVPRRVHHLVVLDGGKAK